MTRTLGRQDSLFIPLGNAPLASPPGDACWECLVPHPEDMKSNVPHIVAPIWGLISIRPMWNTGCDQVARGGPSSAASAHRCATSTRSAIRSLRTFRVCA